MNSLVRLHALQAYLRIRTFAFFHGSRVSLEAWQSKRIEKWLKQHVSALSKFQSTDNQVSNLSRFPIMTKADLMADFAGYNRIGITADEGWAAFSGTRMIGDHIVGASTGTSGNRGLFVISQAERFRWLGTMLAKGLPDFWHHRDRVAVMLPLDTPLYDAANKTARLQLQFFDTSQPLESLTASLARFAPTVLIAPPRILRRLLVLDVPLSVRAVFSASEKLEDIDRTVIEAGFKTQLREIYMATEGLLAVTCAHGKLHLTEDCMHFEMEDIGKGLVSPIITDFSRATQIMLRYRMNDLLRMDESACPCGSPLRVVREIVGRMDDVFLIQSGQGCLIELTPDVLRNTILDSDRSIQDFRLVETAPDCVHLSLETHLPRSVGDRAVQHLTQLFAAHGCAPRIILEFANLDELRPGKLRRVENRMTKGPNGSSLDTEPVHAL